MAVGLESGTNQRPLFLKGIDAFINEDGGYTTVAVALALLVSVTLVFSVAAAEWTMARSADVQQVADAAALSGANVVSAYSTIAQILDACVLSMGLTGVVILGVGLVVCCIPGAQALGEKVMHAAKKVLDARQRFARSCMQGLRRFETALPCLIALNSASSVSANCSQGISYIGCAIPYPQDSQSDFSDMEQETSAEKMEETAKKLREATKRRDDAKKRADAAKERGWHADCLDDPSCLRDRAGVLADLESGDNPNYSSFELWNFGVPISRSRAYYYARALSEAPEAGGPEALTDSEARRAFYEYALSQVNDAWYSEDEAGHVDMNLPDLPKNTDEMRQTSLYTDQVWPCTAEEDGNIVLHSSLDCPGATGAYVGTASLAEEENGAVSLCDECRMNAGDVGRVAAISTIASNGYEHYWADIVEASKEYAPAKNEEVEATNEMKKLGEEGSNIFQQALDQLSVPRARLCPPGAWGCVAVVMRRKGSTVPTELTSAFMQKSSLPAGAAISAAVVAPDNATKDNNILARFFDGVQGEGGFSAGSILDSIGSAWGSILISYGSAFNTVSGTTQDLLQKIDKVFGDKVGSWLAGKISNIVNKTHFSPVDMRQRKPVLVNTQSVFSRAGDNGSRKARQLVQALPDHGTPEEVARALGLWTWDQIKDKKFTVAELPIPGTDKTIPLTIDLATLVGAL